MKYKYNNFAIEAYFYEIQSSFVFIENVFNQLTTINYTIEADTAKFDSSEYYFCWLSVLSNTNVNKCLFIKVHYNVYDTFSLICPQKVI